MHKSSFFCIPERVNIFTVASKLSSCICHWNNWPHSMQAHVGIQSRWLAHHSRCVHPNLHRFAVAGVSGSSTGPAGCQFPVCVTEHCQVLVWTAQTVDMGRDYTVGSGSHMSARWSNDSVNCCHHMTSVIDVWMDMMCRWNDTDWGTDKCSENCLSSCHHFCNNCRMDMPGPEHRPLQWLTSWAIVWLIWLGVDWVT